MQRFLSIDDVPDLNLLVDTALALKQDPLKFNQLGKGKTMGLIFLNPSLRTRLSTQKAAINLGISAMVMNMNQEGWQLEFDDGTVMDAGAAEHVKEAAGVISQYCDIIGIRTFAGLKDQELDYKEHVLSQFTAHASVPVISLESATLHPLQSLADLITIEEHKRKSNPKVVLTWAPHPKALPQAVANSFVQWMKAAEVDLVITHPRGYELSKDFSESVAVVPDQNNALRDADFVYAKNWSCFENYGKILTRDPTWMVTKEKMSLTNNGQFMHCLPMRRNVIATDDVIDQSLVLAQANNRTFAAQAVLKTILESI